MPLHTKRGSYRSYKLVTHSSNHNPFGASIVDHTCRLKLQHVTMTGQSFVEVQASFLTEPQAVEGMQETLTRFHEETLNSLAQVSTLQGEGGGEEAPQAHRAPLGLEGGIGEGLFRGEEVGARRGNGGVKAQGGHGMGRMPRAWYLSTIPGGTLHYPPADPMPSCPMPPPPPHSDHTTPYTLKLVQYMRHRSVLSPFQRSPCLGVGSSRPVGGFELARKSSFQVDTAPLPPPLCRGQVLHELPNKLI